MIARFITWLFGDLSKALIGIPSVYLDAWLYMMAAVFIFWQGYLAGEEAYKYTNPYFLFWLKGIIGGVTSGVVALKMFRSDAWSKYMQDGGGKTTNNTQQK